MTVQNPPTTKTPARSFSDVLYTLVQFREAGISIFILILVVLVSLRAPAFLTVDNFKDILLNISILTIVALGQTMVIITHGIDLSVGSMIGLVGMMVAFVLKQNPDMPVIFAVLLGMALGATLGSFNGLIITFGKVPPIIATLGNLSIYRGLVFFYSQGTWINSFELPAAFKWLATQSTIPRRQAASNSHKAILSSPHKDPFHARHRLTTHRCHARPRAPHGCRGWSTPVHKGAGDAAEAIHPQAASTSVKMAARLENVQAADNFRNLFEVPVLFYALGAVALATHQTPNWLVAGVWAFVVLRVVHSFIHCTYNKVMHRLGAFLAGFGLLLALWVSFFLSLPSGHRRPCIPQEQARGPSWTGPTVQSGSRSPTSGHMAGGSLSPRQDQIVRGSKREILSGLDSPRPTGNWSRMLSIRGLAWGTGRQGLGRFLLIGARGLSTLELTTRHGKRSECPSTPKTSTTAFSSAPRRISAPSNSSVVANSSN